MALTRIRALIDERWPGLVVRPARTVLIAVGLWIVLNLTWDLLVGPGLGETAKSAFRLMTLGSRKLRDEAYASAALDPFMLPGLLLMGLLAAVPASFIGRYWGDRSASRRARRRKLEKELSHIHSDLERRLYLEARERRAMRRMTVFMILLSAYFFVPYVIINQASAARRGFLGEYDNSCAVHLIAGGGSTTFALRGDANASRV